MQVRGGDAVTCQRVVTLLVLIGTAASSHRALADAPILDGDVDRIESANKAFVARPSHDLRSTVVYRTVVGRKPERLWTMRGWQTTAWLSDDGDYLVVGYPGVNLLELGHKPDEVMLSFFRRGDPVGIVRLDQMIEDRAHLRRSVSHFAWGLFVGFVAPHHFAVDTIEDRRLVYDVATGARVAARRSSPTQTPEPGGPGGSRGPRP